MKHLLLLLMLCLTITLNAQTPVPMISQTGLTYTENFADIVNWTDNFASGIGANRFRSVPIGGTGTIPNGERIATSSATFTTGSTGGVQKGTTQSPSTQSIVLLATGATDNNNAVAFDFFVDFTGVNAGMLTFDWASLNNSTGDRRSSLRVYYSIDGVDFYEMQLARVLNLMNNVPTSGSENDVELPDALNNVATVRFRFYFHNGLGGTTGSRPKVSIDNITVTANRPPAITSNGGGNTAGITIGENINAVTTVTATDPDAGQTLSYSLNGGADASKFSINSSTGALTFNVLPDFENPTDAGANNTYEVIVRAGDGMDADEQAITVTVTDANDNSLHLDGINDRVQVPDHNSLDLVGSYTIECWIKPDAFNALAGLVGKYNTAGSNGYTLRLTNTAPYTGLNFDEMSTPNGVLQAGRWYHIAAVNNAGVRKLYINGIEQTLSGTPLSVVANTDVLSIGADYISSPRYFNGNMDEIRLWNVARTQAEIQAAMNITLSLPTTGLVAYYQFEHGIADGNNTSSVTLSDAVNLNNGTLTGFALTGNTSNWVESYARVSPVTVAASNITLSSFTANWTAPTVNTATDYLLDVATDANFTSILASYNGLSTGNVLTYNITGLFPGTDYYYRVRALKTGVGQSISSNTTTVTTTASTAVTITTVSPIIAQPGISVTISGNNFNTTPASNTVHIGGMKATVTAASVNSLTVTVPNGAAYGPVSVLNTGTNTIGYSSQQFLPTFSPARSGVLRSADFTLVNHLPGVAPNLSFLAVGDLDDDGKADLILNSGSPTESNIYIRKNTGTGSTISFAAETVITIAGIAGVGDQVATADIDGDGKQDIIVPGGETDNFAVLRNTGSLSSFASTLFTTGDQPVSAACSDFDGDGKTDIAIINYLSGAPVGVYRNNGTGPGSVSMEAPVNLPTSGGGPLYIAIADLDNDGKKDIIVARGGANLVRVFRNTSTFGSLSFTSSDITVLQGPSAIATGDLNGDGKTDLVVTCSNSTLTSLTILENTSSGSISFSSTNMNVGSEQRHVSISDMNGDGKPDILLATMKNYATLPANDYRVAILTNTSNGTSLSFSSKTEFTTQRFPSRVFTADLNGDNRPDFLSTNHSQSSITIYRNTLQYPPVITSFTPLAAAPGSSVTITGTDFNTTPANNIVYFGATKATVTAASATSLTVTVPTGATHAPLSAVNTFSNGIAYSSKFFLPVFAPNKTTLAATDFTAQPTLNAGTTQLNALTYADLDSDGKPELLHTEPKHLYIRSNASTPGTIDMSSVIDLDFTATVSGSLRHVAIGDLDNDGRPDIAVCNASSSSSNIIILRNTGTLAGFTVAAALTFASDANPGSVTIGDLDGDGLADIAVNCASANALNIFRNNSSSPGTISFMPKSALPLSIAGTIVTCADLNNDGKVELMVTTTSSLLVFPNTSSVGEVSFGTVITNNTPTSTYGVTTGDLDGDGKTDIVVSNAMNSHVSVFRNNGSGSTVSLALRQDITIGKPAVTSSIGDINGDGKPDLVLSHYQTFSSNPIYRIGIMANSSTSGTISFNTPVELDADNIPFINAIVDLDGDSHPDIASGHATNHSIIIYRNNIQFPPVITSFTPQSAAPGSSVTIAGSNFNTTPANNIVYFGATKAIVTAASETSLTVTVPSGATYAAITVLNKYNSLQAASLKNFLPAFAPNKTTLAATDFTVQPNITATGNSIYGLVTGDLNGDGKPDLVQTDDGADKLVIYPNATAAPGDVISYGTAASISLTGILPNPRYLSVADMDGDGWQDIIVPSPTQDSIGIMLNPGTGAVNTFTVNAKFKTGAFPIAAAVGDLDGDGKPDIVTSNYNGSSVSILRNTSTATGAVSFAEKQDVVLATDPVYNLTLADIDNDGKPDIISERDINSNPGLIVVFRNTSTMGNISFAAAVNIPSLQAPWTIVAGDVDGDGLTDLAVGYGGSTGNAVSVFRNTTVGTTISFTRTDHNVQKEQRTIALGDMNGDGKTDIVTGINSPVSGNYYTCVLPNTSTSGNVSFGTRVDLPASPMPWVTLVADMNSDGRPDIVTGITGGPTRYLAVYRNTLVAAPLTQATNIVVNPISTTTATLTWTNGSGEKRAVFIKADNTGTPSPANETDYTASVQFTSGTQIGSTGWYCVYKGTGNSVAVTGLTPATVYRAMVIEYNDNNLPNTAQYRTATATGNPVNFTTVSTNANLSNLSISSGTLSPVFASATTSYSVTVPNTVTNVTVTPTLADATATITVNGTPVTNGNPSGSIALNVGPNTITVTVTAQDGTTIQTYTINVTRDNPLPVTLISFKAYEKNLKGELEWRVANEVNMDAYEIERSANATSFERIGSVAAKGLTAYNWTDASPLKGINYYRLKMLDKDGSFKYSAVTQITITKTKSQFAFVNPVTGKTISLKIDNADKGGYFLHMINNLGQQVFITSIHHQGGSGLMNIKLPQSLSAGIYTVIIKGDNLHTAQQLIIR